MEAAEAILASRLRFQERACERLGSALYADLCGRAAEDVEAHGPVWEVLRGHEREPAESALPLRLLGAVNRLALEGREPAIAARYADGGDPGATWQAFAAALARNVEALRELVELPVQTNEVGRCAALLPGFLSVAGATGLPLRLLEVGASAGLNLRWDRYAYRAKGFSWGPDGSPARIDFEPRGDWPKGLPERVAIASRHGCDAAPVDPTTPEGALTLVSYVWPDQRQRVERLRAAIGLAAEVPVAVDRENAASWVERQLREPVAGQATIVFHSLVAQYLSDEEAAVLHGHLREA
ncbi:MAG TPA: DUF2332 domain-containing protein, partial [Solirubrobacterales bacterium]|nr:DUF2332 domain-containing protein [Solirubrobacterales bacterium]